MAVVTGTIQLTASFLETVSSGVITALSLPATITDNYTYANGTGAGAVDLIYAKQLSLAASATTLDLTSLTDLNGASVNFARVREFLVVNLSTTASQIVTIGAAAATQWTGFLGTTTSTWILQPSVTGTAAFSTLYGRDRYSTGASTGAYVDSTHKSLKLDPGANTISVYVLMVGCSVA